VVIHTYAVGLWKGDPPDVDRAARAALAAVRPFERMLAQYRDVIFESTGRDLPLAVTEYNAAYVQEQPVPLRFSLAAALFSADYVRVMLQPESRVAMANYWQFVNGYWGILRGQRVPGVEAVPWKRMPAYYIFRLWGNHFGNRLVATGVVSPPVEFEGFLRTRPARAGSYERELSFNLRDGEGSSYRWRVTGERSMELSIDGLRGGAYPEFARILPMQGRMIRVSFEARASGAVPATAKLGIGVVDARGWSTVPWGVGIDSIRVTREWERHAAELLVLDDSPGVSLTWRVISEEVAVTGRVDLRDLRAIEVKDDPPFDALTACASLSADGRTVYVVVINKHHAEDVAARVTVGGRRLAGCRVWEVTGPSLAATNLVDEQVRETKTAAPVTLSTGRGFEYVFPRHSMSAFEFVVAQ
jgi:alpha-N-arabinofuranosidase